MSEDLLYPNDQLTYNQELAGYYGEFGAGGNSQIAFLQTGIKPSQLKKISLISDIPGSEKWQVRDLFQREVDQKRVDKSILPYLQSDRVKFFNPITLTVLPVDEHEQIKSDIPLIKPESKKLDSYIWNVLEHEPYYRFRYIEQRQAFGKLEWADERVHLVAIDGQHRLSALKAYFDDPKLSTSDPDGFLGWTIPVVVFGIRRLSTEGQRATVLDVIRNIFVYINTEAKKPSSTRQILLSDESINSVCTQELLQYWHENDLLAAPDPKKAPLMMFDWRGAESGGEVINTPGSLKTTEEMRNWLLYYVLGTDWSPDQQSSLGVQPVDLLHRAFNEKTLKPDTADACRKVFRERVLGSLAHLFEEFTPYKKYIAQLRELETRHVKASVFARHAFEELRFGSCKAMPSQRKQVDDTLDEIKWDIIESQKVIPYLLLRDIGMRAVMYAFGRVKEAYEVEKAASVTWSDYGEWFVIALNSVYDDGWFDPKSKVAALRRHISHDQNDQVINYRLEKAECGLGGLIAAAIVAKGFDAKSDTRGLAAEYLGDLDLLKGHKKEQKVILRNDKVFTAKNPESTDEFKKRVNADAGKACDAQLKKIRKALGVT